MTVKLAINGFGRIGRLVLRALIEGDFPDVEIFTLGLLNELMEGERRGWRCMRGTQVTYLLGPRVISEEKRSGNI